MQQSEIKIRTATPSDIGDVLRINEFFSNAYSHREEFFREGLTAGRIIVADQNGTVVGYLIYEVLWGNTPFLALVKVAPESRGQGVGKKLLGALEEKLQKENFAALVSSSEEVNQSGNEYHQKMGFKNIGTVEMIYGKEVFYRKDLK